MSSREGQEATVESASSTTIAERDSDLEGKVGHIKIEAEGEINKSESDSLLVEFGFEDERNPYHWAERRKWITLTICCNVRSGPVLTFFGSIYTGLVGGVGPSYASGEDDMVLTLGITRELAIVGLSMFVVSFGVAPLVLAPFSEITGRYKMYVYTVVLFTLCFIPLALAPNIQMVIVFRVLQGIVGSTGSTLVGGTVADLFLHHDRGNAMGFFALFAIGGTGLGASIFGFTAERYGWRYIQWIQMALSGALAIAIILFTEETRGSVVLAQDAKRLRDETSLNYRSDSDLHPVGIKALIKISMTRPLLLLFGEPIVALLSIYAAVFWGTLYLLLEAVPLVFARFDWNLGQVNSVLYSITLGAIIGYLGDRYIQQPLYNKYYPTRGPESRLFSSFVAGPLFAIGLYIFAFTSTRGSAAGPIIGLTISFVGSFTLYLAVFNYLADGYGSFASSAISASSFCRNVVGGCFPLFTPILYRRLGLQYASLLAALIATLLAGIPFLLFFFGPKLRERSAFAKTLKKS